MFFPLPQPSHAHFTDPPFILLPSLPTHTPPHSHSLPIHTPPYSPNTHTSPNSPTPSPHVYTHIHTPPHSSTCTNSLCPPLASERLNQQIADLQLNIKQLTHDKTTLVQSLNEATEREHAMEQRLRMCEEGGGGGGRAHQVPSQSWAQPAGVNDIQQVWGWHV